MAGDGVLKPPTSNPAQRRSAPAERTDRSFDLFEFDL
jgi:hypothetical protein